jgi:hypothetical protein
VRRTPGVSYYSNPVARQECIEATIQQYKDDELRLSIIEANLARAELDRELANI